jgi:hypothetical protein
VLFKTLVLDCFVLYPPRASQLNNTAVNAILQEPVFIPRPKARAGDDGWLLVPVHNAATLRTDLCILDAARILAGPVAVIHLPHHLPYGEHGIFTKDYLGPDRYAVENARGGQLTRAHGFRKASKQSGSQVKDVAGTTQTGFPSESKKSNQKPVVSGGATALADTQKGGAWWEAGLPPGNNATANNIVVAPSSSMKLDSSAVLKGSREAVLAEAAKPAQAKLSEHIAPQSWTASTVLQPDVNADSAQKPGVKGVKGSLFWGDVQLLPPTKAP